jgi:hypothetical protein
MLADRWSDVEAFAEVYHALSHCPLVKKFYTSLGRFGVTMVMV